MGKSVLTPEDNLPGKASEANGATRESLACNGGKGIRPTFRNLPAGI